MVFMFVLTVCRHMCAPHASRYVTSRHGPVKKSAQTEIQQDLTVRKSNTEPATSPACYPMPLLGLTSALMIIPRLVSYALHCMMQLCVAAWLQQHKITPQTAQMQYRCTGEALISRMPHGAAGQHVAVSKVDMLHACHAILLHIMAHKLGNVMDGMRPMSRVHVQLYRPSFALSK